MALFKLQERPTDNIEAIMRKTKEQKDIKPTIKLKGTSLLAKLNAIKQKVKETLGEHINDYQLITTDEEWIEYCNKAKEDEYIAIDTETDSLDSILANLVGVCIYSHSQKPAYVPVGHISVITEQKIEPQVSIEAIKEGLNIIKDSKLIFHNAYYDLVVIYQNTGIMLNVYDDTLIMAWYLNENEAHGLKYLYDKYCETQNGIHTFGELFEGIPACYVPYDIFMAYAAKDAYMTYKLWEFYKQYMTHGTEECEECKLDRVIDVYETVEKPLLKVLVKMKLRGVRFDFERAKQLKKKYLGLKEEAEKEFHRAVEPYKKEILERQKLYGDIEYPLNFNSPLQIKILFYDIIQIGVIYKKEPTGTGNHVLEEILNNKKYEKHPIYNIAKTLQDVKKYDKLISSFIDKLSEDATLHEGKIFCNFNQCGTNTLRLSSSSPNLQQVPSKNDDIRNMFRADDGCIFCNLDFSQQEMMAVASLADDDKMLESFHLGRDIYSHVASIAFNVPYEECLEFNPDGSTNKEGKNRRKKAKAICLGICYGKGVPAIADDLHITVEVAQQVKDSVLKAFPKLAQYLQDVVEFGKKYGYVENYFGCKRRLPALQLPEYTFEFPIDIEFADNAENTKKYYTNLYLGKLSRCYSREDKAKIIEQAKEKNITIKNNSQLIAQETRNAYNSPVQSTAAILTKMAMVNIDSNERLKELNVSLVLTIHDEVALNIPKEHAYEAVQIAKKEFLGAGKDLKADLRCDIEMSECWAGESLSFDENHNLVKK